MTDKKTHYRFGISRRVGLGLLVTWPLLIIGLSAIGERFALIYAVTLLGSLPALIGAIAWFKMGQQHSRVLLQKRLIIMLTATLALSISITHWPLRLAVWISTPTLNAATKERRKIVEEIEFSSCGTYTNWAKRELTKPLLLKRIGLWAAPGASGRDWELIVFLQPRGARLLYQEDGSWKILY